MWVRKFGMRPSTLWDATGLSACRPWTPEWGLLADNIPSGRQEFGDAVSESLTLWDAMGPVSM